uniref:Uncharacterized protein n=1 Tax=Trichogramma kaykai TaxID=54128 RepID=A0ABD2WVF3_9HYME
MHTCTGRSPLHIALDNDCTEVFELLLREGANPNFAYDDALFTPLHSICKMEDGDDNLVKMLFEISDEKHVQVQVDARNILGETPLHLALEHDNIEIAKLLLQKGADPNSANDEGETALHLLCQVKDDPDSVEMIFEACHDKYRPVQINAENGEGDAPLTLALLNSKPEVAKCLLKRGANQNFANKKGFTPLHILSKDDFEGDGKRVKLYFDICDAFNRPVLVDAKNSEGLTPLQLAVAYIRPSAVDVLLDHGADLSNFVFPNESYFGKELGEAILTADCLKTKLQFKLNDVTRLLPIINRLEKGGYELDREDALMIMKFFAQYEMFEKWRDLEEYNWLDDEEFLATARNIMVKPDLSFYDAIQLPPREAAVRLEHTDYCDVANTFKDFRELPERQQKACVMHLCEKATRRFFYRWALDPLWKLIHHRLPIVCCDMILDNLKNEDLCNICLAAVSQN